MRYISNGPEERQINKIKRNNKQWCMKWTYFDSMQKKTSNYMDKRMRIWIHKKMILKRESCWKYVKFLNVTKKIIKELDFYKNVQKRWHS